MPVCEDTKYMSDDVFSMVLRKSNSIRRETEGLMSTFHLLGTCHSFRTMPEGSIARAAMLLREAADYLDEMAQETQSVRQDTYLQAAE